MKIFLKCNEAANVCNKSQYKEDSFREKMSLRLHLILCKMCRNFSKQNEKLTNTIKSSNIKTLTPEEKQYLKSQLKKDFNKQQSS